jgi:protein TonB
MTAAALTDDAGAHREILRWGTAAAVVVAAHATAIAGYVLLHHPNPRPAGEPVVLVEMAAEAAAPVAAVLDIPEEQPAEQSEPEPEVTKSPEEPPPLPPPPVFTQAIPLPEPVPPKPQVKPKKPPAPRTVAAARAPVQAPTPSTSQLGVSGADARAAQATWRDLVAAHLRRYKGVPRTEGTVVVGFTVDRSGHVLSRRIARSSGQSELDEEALAMIQRAQPLPAFPPSMTQSRMDVSVPLRFTTH